MDLEHWRNKIDELNEKIVDLLSERARCAIEVGKIKRDSGQPMYAPERETAVLNQLKTLNKGPLSDEAIQRIFRQVIDEALRLEQEHADEES
jgi:chorismate mutase-like protein